MAVRWADLDGTARERALADLRAAFDRLAPAFADPELGPVVERWLNVPDLRFDILLVGGHPVITNWGLLPLDLADSAEGRRVHFERGLGALLQLHGVPAFADDDRPGGLSLRPAAATPVVANSPLASEASIGLPVAAGALAASPIEATPVAALLVEPRRPWLAPAIASGVAALLLLLLLFWPSFGVVASVGSLPVVDPAAAADMIATLEQRASGLRNDLSNGVCRRAEAAPAVTGEGIPLNPATPGASAASPPTLSALAPPSPATTQAQGSENLGIVEALERAGVLVIAPGQSGFGQGTGFFISPTDIVTNLHVIADANAEGIVVINRALGRVVPARVIARSARVVTIGKPDFAVLRIEGASAPAILSVASRIAKGENIIAGGFPSVIMETDATYQRLIGGDLQAAPEIAVTQGMVTTFQEGQDGLGLILHTAAISPGNSGGPLADYCGRAVGVNTFLRSGSDQSLPLNFAQRSSALASFLVANGIPFTAADDACAPRQIEAAAAPSSPPVQPGAPTTPAAPAAAPAPAPATTPEIRP